MGENLVEMVDNPLLNGSFFPLFCLKIGVERVHSRIIRGVLLIIGETHQNSERKMNELYIFYRVVSSLEVFRVVLPLHLVGQGFS